MASFHHVSLLLLCFCSAAFADIGTFDCKENSPIRSPQMSANIDAVLAQVDKNTAKNDGFSIATYGKGKDTVYGLGQCRKDVNASVCSDCIHDAASNIRLYCSTSYNSSDERVFSQYCLLRFSDQKFFGKFDPSTFISLPLNDKAHKVKKNPKFFGKQVEILISYIISNAIEPVNKGFAKGTTKISSSELVYGVVQCTEDLSTSTCKTCLETGFANLPKLCRKYKTKACRLQYGSCYLRYDTDEF